MSFAPPESSEDASLHNTEASLESGAPPARVRDEFPPAPALPEIPPLELPGFTPPPAPVLEHSPWPLGVADAAAEFAALRASSAALTPVEAGAAAAAVDESAATSAAQEETAASPPAVEEGAATSAAQEETAASPAAVETEASAALTAPVEEPVTSAAESASAELPPAAQDVAPAPTALAEPVPSAPAATPVPVESTEPRVSYDPFPVSLEQRVVTVTSEPSPESYEPPQVVWSPGPPPVETHEVAVTAFGTPEPAPESNPSDRVSIEWVADPFASNPAPNPAEASPQTAQEVAAAPPVQADGGGYLERYQRLFAGDSSDPQRAILAALDAAIQAPVSESPREPATAASAPTPITTAGDTQSLAAVPAEALGAGAAVPGSARPVAVPADVVNQQPSAVAASPSAATQGSSEVTSAPKLDVARDVDWSQEVLATAARAAAAAAERARAQQLQAQADAALVSSQRVAVGLAPLDKSAEKAPAEPRMRASMASMELDPATGERLSRHRSRKSRRSRFTVTPVVLVSFVGSVIIALGVGFVSGFMIGKETGKSAENAQARAPEPQLSVAAAEPASPTVEGAPARRKGAGPAGSAEPGTPVATGAGVAAAPAKFLRGPFDERAARAALSKAAASAGGCVPAGDAGGEAVVTVTLDPSGVTSNAAVYGARFAGTDAGECIARLLRGVKVRPFTGEPVTVKKTIQVN